MLKLVIFIAILCLNQAFAKPYISYFGEAKYQNNFGHYDYANPNASKGGAITFGTVGSFDSLNPFILAGNSADGLSYTYDTLLSRSLDEISTYYGLLAEDISLNAQDNSVTFTIRKNAKWHDGSAISNSDILFSYNHLKEYGHPEYQIQLQSVIKATLVGNNKIKFYLTDITNKDLIFTIGSLPIISETYYQNHDFSKATLEPFLGSGPYKILEAKAGKYIIYERNENYWGKDLSVNKGRYNFAQIKYKYYRDATIAVMAFKAGEYDLRSENIAKNWANEYNISEVIDGRIIKEKITHQIPTGMQAFVLNNRLTKFKNHALRKALNLAFDFEWTNKNLFFSAYNRTNSFFSNSPFAAPSIISEKELSLIEQFDLEIKATEITKLNLPTTDGNGNNRKHLLQAAKLLEEAGYYLEGMKLHDPITKEAITLEFLTVSPSFQRVILPYIKNLKKLGIDAHIKLVDFSIYQKRLESFDYEVTIHIFRHGMIPGIEQFSYWHSSNINKNGSSNIAGIANPDIDKLVTAISQAQSLNELKALTSLLDRILMANDYVVPQWNLNAFRLVYWNKFNKPNYNPPYGLAIDYWWSKETQ